MSRRYDCSDPVERAKALGEAVSAVRRGELVVLPTDTVYGIGADAFTPAAVGALLEAKGRGRDMPAPVLIGSVRAAQALIDDFGAYGQDLVDEFWPGALTLVCRANSTLAWDLGETKGTVAVRMPLHQLALELLKETGPLAVSSANRSGAAPARTAAEAEEQLGDAIEVYLDGGPSGEHPASTIVDLTGAIPRLLRAGAIPEERVREVCGVLLTDSDFNEDEDEDRAREHERRDGEHERRDGEDERRAGTANAGADTGAGREGEDKPRGDSGAGREGEDKERGDSGTGREGADKARGDADPSRDDEGDTPRKPVR